MATNIQNSLVESYNKNLMAQLAALQNKYNNNMSTLDAQAAKLPEQYQGIKNNAAVTRAMDKQGFNEFAAGSGLNSGASGQAELARNNVYGNALASADRSMAEQLANYNLQRQQMANDYSAQETSLRAGNQSDMMSALASQMNADRTFQANQQNTERNNFMQDIGAYSNDYMAQIQRVQGDNDATNDWQIPLLQSARNEKLQALAQAQGQARQQEFENQLAMQKARSSGTSKTTTPSYGGYTATEIRQLVDAGIMDLPTAQKLLGLTATPTTPQGNGGANKGIEQLSPTGQKIAERLVSQAGSPRDKASAIEAAYKAGTITEQDADVLLKAIGF